MARKSVSKNNAEVSAGAATPSRRKPTTTGRATRSVAAQAAATVSGPSHAEIARLAYSYWEARAHRGGSPEEDWLRAERELRRRGSTAGA